MKEQTTLQKIEEIISANNIMIKDNIDPTNKFDIFEAKLGIIDHCIKALAIAIDEIK